jgi:hypothetical protein
LEIATAQRGSLARIRIGCAVALFLAAAPPVIAQAPAQAIPIDGDDIAGVVRGPRGPEAGVWVIAETTDLPTKFARIVVTDDQGRYLVPDLPQANYSVWVRGYGLVDAPKVRAIPGRQLDLVAIPAPNDAAAAHYYPAIYWYSMLTIPDAKEDGLLRQGLRRPHRRSECRLERPRPVDDERRPHAVAEGRRQGQRADRSAVPAAAGSVGEIAAPGASPERVGSARALAHPRRIK